MTTQPASLNEFQITSAPDWSKGCGKCECGLLDPPPLTGVESLYMERLAQYKLFYLVFCDCPAGGRYEVYLKNLEQRLIGEARRHPMMGQQAQRNTHPDIENAMNAVAEAMPIPTMHYESGRERQRQLYEYAHR